MYKNFYLSDDDSRDTVYVVAVDNDPNKTKWYNDRYPKGLIFLKNQESSDDDMWTDDLESALCFSKYELDNDFFDYYYKDITEYYYDEEDLIIQKYVVTTKVKVKHIKDFNFGEFENIK